MGYDGAMTLPGAVAALPVVCATVGALATGVVSGAVAMVVDIFMKFFD